MSFSSGAGGLVSRVRLCDSTDCSLPGSSVRRIFQTRILSGLPFQLALVVKKLPANAGDVRDADSIPGSLLPGGGHGNPLQYSFLESPMGRGAWQATVHKSAKLDATEAT